MSKVKPPSIPHKFFQWYCKPSLQETILGDLEEQFEEDLESIGLKRARRRFAWTVLRFFRKGIIKPLHGGGKLNYLGMFKHNLLITFRGFKRHKTVFGINLIGLITSLTCVIFSAIWVNDELQKDRFHDDSGRLFQVYSRFDNTDGITVWQGVTGLLDTEIEAQIPQVNLSTVSTDVHEYSLSIDNKRFKAQGRFGDKDYLDIFNYPLLKGQKAALADPSNILITSTLAKRMFGAEDAVGKSITWHFWNSEKTFKVAGILEDPTSATSDPFEFILSWKFYHDELINFKQWGNYYGRVVIKLDELSKKELVEKKINEIFQSNNANEQVELFLANYSDQYLYGNYENGQQAGGRIDYVYLAIVVAAFILLIACINFVNLSTAFASLKVKEIGVKKTFGASKSQLAIQFFLESILLSALSICIALVLVIFLLEPFNQITGKELVFVLDWKFLGLILLFIPSIGLIAGLFPAIYLSGLEVISALKGKSSESGGAWSRKILVFVQFTLSIILIVGTLIVSQQVDYALNKNLGYDRDNLLYFLREGQILERSDTFMAELRNTPGVKLVSQSGFSVAPGLQNRTSGISWDGKGEDQQVQFWENNGDAKSAEIIGLELVEGRFFNDQLNTEESSIIFNETAIHTMGLQDPIGKTVEHYSGKKTIVGVVKDFTTESLHNPIEPAMFHYRPERAHYILAKIEKGKELQTVSEIESVYKKFNPNYPFDAKFVDQDYQAMYDSEMRVAKLSRLFSGLAILISCLGLFGLTIFQVQRRVKEIGIKKVLGAESWKLALSMTYEFTKSVLISLLVALPVSYYLGEKWLEGFSYSIELKWWFFVLAGFLALIIAWLTVSSQTWKAAIANPVESLKDE
ncbi:MAG: ABC transporter permease [Ekhidna sp.]